MSLSGGQQQRLCIARALAVDPEVILMDEPCSALDPVATLRIEELIGELRQSYTIVIVTHNMQQASRVSDMTAFFTMGDDRAGYLVEIGADCPDLHRSQEPADRGLRLRPVRLRSDAMTDEHEPTGAATSVQDQAAAILNESRTTVRPHLDRGEREIKDAVLRMGILVEEQILAALEALDPPRRRARRSRSSRTTARSTRRSSTCRRRSRP